jgi:phosphoribosyl 1,2-cyclic phosphodiesterase
LLIDAGIGPRTLAKRMDGTGCALADIQAIVLTHLDRDHFSLAWIATILRRQIPVFVHQQRIEEFLSLACDFNLSVRTFDNRDFSPLPGLVFTPLALAHDQAGSHGFVIAGFGGRIGYATDLGRVPVYLLAAFEELDILAIESNYDPQMQLASARPYFLKQRIMGGSGHLSNAQALAAVRQVLDRADARRNRLPSRIVLLHRSRQCNCPKLLQRLFASDQRIAPRLVLAEQYERTEWLRPVEVAPHVGEQLVMSWG